jgi:hypothetical protein
MKSTKNAKELADWLGGVDVFIGARHESARTPSRAKRVPDACPLTAVRLFLQCSDYRNLKFELSQSASNCASRPHQLSWCDLVHELDTQLDAIWQAKGRRPLVIVVDLTDADWEVGFFILPLVYQKTYLEVICTFTSPDTYPQADERNAHPPVDTHSIRQPPGWTADLGSNGQNPWHVLFLGFDHDRAQKFIEHYDWIRECCIAVIGDPAYVSNGVGESEKANELFLKQIPNTKENRRRVGAANPTDTMRLLQELFAQRGALNIMLLGTSPMTMGAVWFYLQLSDAEKSRVRFLHDFPLRQTGRTDGVGQTWLYSRPSHWGVGATPDGASGAS